MAGADLAVEHRDVVVDRHVNPRDVQLLLERTETGPDPVRDDVVGDVGRRVTTGQSVEDSRRARRRVAHVAREPVGRPPRDPTDARVRHASGDGSNRTRDHRTGVYEHPGRPHRASSVAPPRPAAAP